MSAKIPTMEELKWALRIPEVEHKLDRLGRVVTKKNVNYQRGKKIFPGKTSEQEVRRAKTFLYGRKS